MTNEQVFSELYYTRKAINLVMGFTPKCWRAPFGDVDNRVRFIAQQMNLTSILWSDDSVRLLYLADHLLLTKKRKTGVSTPVPLP